MPLWILGRTVALNVVTKGILNPTACFSGFNPVDDKKGYHGTWANDLCPSWTTMITFLVRKYVSPAKLRQNTRWLLAWPCNSSPWQFSDILWHWAGLEKDLKHRNDSCCQAGRRTIATCERRCLVQSILASGDTMVWLNHHLFWIPIFLALAPLAQPDFIVSTHRAKSTCTLPPSLHCGEIIQPCATGVNVLGQFPYLDSRLHCRSQVKLWYGRVF